MRILKVVDSLVKKSTKKIGKDDDLLKLLYAKKVAKTTAKELEKERRKLSSRLETRS